MIHQVYLPDADQQWLSHLIKVQLALFFLAARTPHTASVGAFGAEALARQLDPLYVNSAAANQAAAWIAGRPSWMKELETFAQHPDSHAKKQLAWQVCGDILTLDQPHRGGLRAIWEKRGEPDWRKAAKEFFLQFYERWGEKYSEEKQERYGFPNYLFRKPPPTDSYNRWHFINHFAATNATLYVCAICDGAGYMTKTDNRTYTSIEHFFPKSRYPHLAIHPRNLIPICANCNTIASDKDILQGKQRLSALLLPYLEEEGLREQTHVRVTEQAELPYPLRVTLESANERDNGERIASFTETYDVESRWNLALEQIELQLFRRIEHFLRPDLDQGAWVVEASFSGQRFTLDFVRGRLQVLLGLTIQDGWGSDPFAFLSSWLLKYYLDTLEKHEESAPVFIALREWANGQQQVWEALSQAVQRLYARVPLVEIEEADE